MNPTIVALLLLKDSSQLGDGCSIISVALGSLHEGGPLIVDESIHWV